MRQADNFDGGVLRKGMIRKGMARLLRLHIKQTYARFIQYALIFFGFGGGIIARFTLDHGFHLSLLAASGI